MDSIYKCYDGTYIDLERVVSIRKIDYDKFGIFFQLKSEPILLGRWKEDGTSLLAVGGNKLEPDLFQLELDNLINVWKEYKNKQVN